MAHANPPLTGPGNNFNNRGNQFNNTGSGPQNANTDRGVQYNNTGPGTQNNSSKVDDMKVPLPEGFVPAVIELAGRDRGDPNGAWTDPTSEEIVEIWNRLSPLDMVNKFLYYKKDITETVTRELTTWRNSFGEAAIKALNLKFPGKLNREDQEYIDDQTRGNLADRECYYLYPESGFLQSPIVAETFSEHVKAIGSNSVDQFWKENEPTSALVLTILAIERAFRLRSSSSTNSISQSRELSSDEETQKLTSAAFEIVKKVPKIEWEIIVGAAKKVDESAALPRTFA
ncbi:hypothetical protein D9758_014605 [Tetrapyrgos nigripes]|uniref:Uncharacterized protein n=1 Tax=Tetrapyrgos nigripes TaxID=182062 RepID=A0A8H5FUF9_9AGAR|nr:hypothetical protein D9758_014605 [Tetrapyrgos nigripes]